MSNLIDKNTKKSNISNAERLNNCLETKLSEANIRNTHITIVKGFNLLNAYSMSSNVVKGNIETIPLASDDLESKEYIMKLCSQIGFQAIDMGGLKNSNQLELANNSTFVEWKYPSLICILFLITNFVWTFFMYFLFPKRPKSFGKFLEDFSPLSHLNKVFGYTSLQILAFVYFAGIIASFYQLRNGTKYKLFPKYLDFWLKTRKQFGLWAFMFASFHVLMTIFVTNPSYMSEWYRIDKNSTSPQKMTVHGELNVLTGIAAYIIMSLVALSSINSIANSFNWKEWRFVQSKIGIVCLFAAFLHDFSMYLRIFLAREEKSYNSVYLLTRVKLLGLYFPLLVLILRFVVSYFPPISNRIEKIRNGYVLKTKEQI